jgi:hypothetical protein
VIRFPSIDWFLALKDLRERRLRSPRRLDTGNLVFVAKIDGHGWIQCFEVLFQGGRCTSVRAVADPQDAAPGAVVLEGDLDTWREMIDAIRQYSGADQAHTLRTLTIVDHAMRVSAKNPLDVDRFYRQLDTAQAFFDDAAKLDCGALNQAGDADSSTRRRSATS